MQINNLHWLWQLWLSLWLLYPKLLINDFRNGLLCLPFLKLLCPPSFAISFAFPPYVATYYIFQLSAGVSYSSLLGGMKVGHGPRWLAEQFNSFNTLIASDLFLGSAWIQITLLFLWEDLRAVFAWKKNINEEPNRAIVYFFWNWWLWLP